MDKYWKNSTVGEISIPNMDAVLEVLADCWWLFSSPFSSGYKIVHDKGAKLVGSDWIENFTPTVLYGKYCMFLSTLYKEETAAERNHC